MGLFGGNSTSVQQTTEQSFDQRFQTGDNSIGLGSNASFSNELPDNAVTLFSNFADALVGVAKAGIDTSASQSTNSLNAVRNLANDNKSTTAAVDFKTYGPYIIGAIGIIAVAYIIIKGK